MTKTLILDYSKWRCGGNRGENILGEGETSLHNIQDFECCLGQFALQLNSKLSVKDIMEVGIPSALSYEVEGLNYPIEGSNNDGDFEDTQLSESAMDINDNSYTTPEKKIEHLKELFRTKGYEINVINKP